MRVVGLINDVMIKLKTQVISVSHHSAFHSQVAKIIQIKRWICFQQTHIRFSQIENNKNNKQQDGNSDKNLATNVVYSAFILSLDIGRDESHPNEDKNANSKENRALPNQFVARNVYSTSSGDRLNQHRKTNSNADVKDLGTNRVVDCDIAMAQLSHANSVLQIRNGEHQRDKHKTNEHTNVAMV